MMAPELSGEAKAVLARLDAWRERNWLRRLDVAFARFIAMLPAQFPPEGHSLPPPTPAPLLLAAALVSHLEGRGHCCLPVAQLVDGTGELLGFEPEAMAELRSLWAGLTAAVPACRCACRWTASSPTAASAAPGRPTPTCRPAAWAGWLAAMAAGCC